MSWRLYIDSKEARAQFKADKANLDALKAHRAPSLYGLSRCFKIGVKGQIVCFLSGFFVVVEL